MRVERQHHGFSIVELIIVITIIAVLASAVAFAMFDGPRRARNAERLKAADVYITLLSNFYTSKGYYPTRSGAVNYVCLGEGYPDFDGDTTRDCYDLTNAGPPYNTADEDATFTTELKAYNNGRLPLNIKTPVVDRLGVSRVGPVLNYGGMEVIFFLEGDNEKCAVQKLVLAYSSNGTTYCYAQLEQ
ncbi:type II secretion system protein [Candidatus Saccharibacteria bacterium]|nr:type II secretion system protein [Candidatus Saccharibacteria bacterium]